MSVKRGIYVAPFDALVDPRLLAELARRAESRGWDGFFLWDHVAYREPVQAVADPWVALAAIACATTGCGSGRWSRRSRAGGSTSSPEKR